MVEKNSDFDWPVEDRGWLVQSQLMHSGSVLLIGRRERRELDFSRTSLNGKFSCLKKTRSRPGQAILSKFSDTRKATSYRLYKTFIFSASVRPFFHFSSEIYNSNRPSTAFVSWSISIWNLITSCILKLSSSWHSLQLLWHRRLNFLRFWRKKCRWEDKPSHVPDRERESIVMLMQ